MRHLVALPFEVFTPAAIAAGVDVWTWIISEKPECEFDQYFLARNGQISEGHVLDFAKVL